MKFLPFLVSHALVFAGARMLTPTFGAAMIFSCVVAACLLALGWLDLTRPVRPLRLPTATLLRPRSTDRSSRRSTVPLRRAA